MNCLVDKELAGWMHLVSCGQWFYVQMEAGDKWYPSRLLELVLFNIFITDIVRSSAPSVNLQMMLC